MECSKLTNVLFCLGFVRDTREFDVKKRKMLEELIDVLKRGDEPENQQIEKFRVISLFNFLCYLQSI